MNNVNTTPTFFDYQKELSNAVNLIDENNIMQLLETLVKAFQNDNYIFICGNGGSGSTADHIACDLGKNVSLSGKYNKGFPIINLTNNTSLITAEANDVSYDSIFEVQLKTLGKENDVLFVISASGNSKNIIKAILFAKKIGMKTVGFLGFDGGECKNLLDEFVLVPSFNYGIVEDIHLSINHFYVHKMKTIKSV